MSWKKGQGYEASYCASLERVEEEKRRQREELSREWSDPPGPASKRCCPQCGKMVSIKARHVERTILTGIGEVTYRRHHYWCPSCRHGFFPKDNELGFDEENLTGDTAGWALDFVMSETFAASSERMALHHDISISPTRLLHLFQRKSQAISDSSTPCPPHHLCLDESDDPRPVVVEIDGSMVRRTDGWREVSLLSVQHLGDAHWSYLSDFDKQRLESQMSQSRGFDRLGKQEVLWIADGSAWIWNMKERLCPNAKELLDYYHAMQHAHEAAKALFGDTDACAKLFADRIAHLLMEGGIEQLFDELKECIPYQPGTEEAKKDAAILWPLLEYYEKNRNRLNYQQFRANCWPLGSGSVESAHKRVIQKRMKQAGMKWSPENAQRMASMRALYCSVGPKSFLQAVEQYSNMAA